MSALTDLIRCLPDWDPYEDAEGYVFDEDRALLALDFWESHITHVEGEPDIAGEPYKLEPHEAALIANIFGWIDPETGYRRFKTVFYYVPRKNSKTTWAAGLMILILFLDPSRRMQLYSLGAAGDQAEIIYDIMVAMIAADPELSARTKVTQSPKQILLKADGSRYRPKSTDSKGQHGKNTQAVIYDEIHEYKNDEAIGALHTSMATRRQGLEVYTTTADHEGESVCNRKYEYACNVRDGVIRNPRYMPVIYEVPEHVVERDPDYWKKEKWWRYANPLYGKSVQPDYFRAEVEEAIRQPHLRPRFQRLHLNVRVSSVSRMIAAEKWQLNAGPYGKEEFKGQIAAGAALDLGMYSDLCSLCLLFGDAERGFRAIWWHWIPEKAAVDYEETKGLPFREWHEQGWITITPGDEIDYERILEDLAGPDPKETDPEKRKKRGIGQDYVICAPGKPGKQQKALAVDRLFQGVWLCQQLAKRGWLIEEFGQGYLSMAAPVAEFLRLVNLGKWAHGDNPLMKWQARNAVAERNNNEDMKPSKRNSEAKIDGIVTGIMATGMALKEPADARHAYQTRGMRFLRPPSPEAGVSGEPPAVDRAPSGPPEAEPAPPGPPRPRIWRCRHRKPPRGPRIWRAGRMERRETAV